MKVKCDHNIKEVDYRISIWFGEGLRRRVLPFNAERDLDLTDNQRQSLLIILDEIAKEVNSEDAPEDSEEKD